MSPPELRSYQARADAEVLELLREPAASVCLVAPTGAGKTVMGARLAAVCVDRGLRVAWCGHRAELLEQADGALALEGLAGRVPTFTIQALARGVADGVPPADLVIFDEAHHLGGADWGRVATAYAGARLVGLTATPERDDGGSIPFKSLVVAALNSELFAAGAIVGCDVIGPAKRQTGKLAADPAEAYLKHGDGRPAIIFCANVEHAQEVAAALPSATCIDGNLDDKERARRIAAYRAGDVDVLTGCQILTEGFDAPRTAVVVLARTCGSMGLYLQCVGRAMRPYAGKTRGLVVDLVGACHEHGLPDEDRRFSLTGTPIEQVEGLPAVAQCRACGACFRSGPRACPGCGAALPPPKKPKVSPEELRRIRATEPLESKAAYWEHLRAQATANGYRIGWAVARFTGRYGHGPDFRRLRTEAA